jgi:hypothetical protein
LRGGGRRRSAVPLDGWRGGETRRQAAGVIAERCGSAPSPRASTGPDGPLAAAGATLLSLDFTDDASIVATMEAINAAAGASRPQRAVKPHR